MRQLSAYFLQVKITYKGNNRVSYNKTKKTINFYIILLIYIILFILCYKFNLIKKLALVSSTR